MPDESLSGQVAVVTTDFLNKIIQDLADGTAVGEGAVDFLVDNQDRLVGLSMKAFKTVVESLKGAKSVADVYKARVDYVNTLSVDDLLDYQSTSADKLYVHPNRAVRATSFFDTAAEVAGNVLPKLLPVLLKFIL